MFRVQQKINYHPPYLEDEIDRLMQTVYSYILLPRYDHRCGLSQSSELSERFSLILKRDVPDDFKIGLLADIWELMVDSQAITFSHNVSLRDIFLHSLLVKRKHVPFILKLLQERDLITFQDFMSTIIDGQTLFELKIVPMLINRDFSILELMEPDVLKRLLLHKYDFVIVQKAVRCGRCVTLSVLWNNIVASCDDPKMQERANFVSILLKQPLKKAVSVINHLLDTPSFHQFFFSPQRTHHIKCLIVLDLNIPLSNKLQLLDYEWNTLSSEPAKINFTRQLFDIRGLKQHVDILASLIEKCSALTLFLSSSTFLNSAFVDKYTSLSFYYDKRNIFRAMEFIDTYFMLFPKLDVRQYKLIKFYITDGIPFIMERCAIEGHSIQPFLNFLKKLHPYLNIYSNGQTGLGQRAVLESINRHLMMESLQAIKPEKRAILLNSFARNSALCWCLLSYAAQVSRVKVTDVYQEFGFLVKLSSVTSSHSRFSDYVEYMYDNYLKSKKSLIALLRSLSIEKMDELNANPIQQSWASTVFSTLALSSTFFGLTPAQSQKHTRVPFQPIHSAVHHQNERSSPDPFIPPKLPNIAESEMVPFQTGIPTGLRHRKQPVDVEKTLGSLPNATPIAMLK